MPVDEDLTHTWHQLCHVLAGVSLCFLVCRDGRHPQWLVGVVDWLVQQVIDLKRGEGSFGSDPTCR